jgi:hypothetical protein
VYDQFSKNIPSGIYLSSPPFSPLSLPLIPVVKAIMHKKDVPQGEVLWKKGEPAVEAYLVSSGCFVFSGMTTYRRERRKYREDRGEREEKY